MTPTGKEAIIASLLDNRENLGPLREWLAAREAACRNGEDNLTLTIDLAEVYLGAGLLDAATETIDAAYLQLEGEDLFGSPHEARLRELETRLG